MQRKDHVVSHRMVDVKERVIVCGWAVPQLGTGGGTQRPRYVEEPIRRHARALIYRLFDEKDPPSVSRETRR